MSDEEIAKRCGLKVSDVRAVLNRLHEYGVTTYIRERDKDTGWFSYNWVVNVIKLYDLVEHRKASGARQDQEKLAYEKSYTFYTCSNSSCSSSGQRVPESDAILTTYSCTNCGNNLTIFDNSEIIKTFEQKLASRAQTERTFVEEARTTTSKAPDKKAGKTVKVTSKKPSRSAFKLKSAKKTKHIKAKSASRKAKKRR